MSQTVSEYLRAHGWARSDDPPGWSPDCGDSSERVGYCEKPARWTKGVRRLCAQHAMRAQRYDEGRLMSHCESESHERCPRCGEALRYLGQAAYRCAKCSWRGVL